MSVPDVQAAVPRIGDAREDWKILRALSEVLDKTLPYTSLQDMQRRLADLAPHLGRVDTVETPLWLNGQYFKVKSTFARCKTSYFLWRRVQQ